MDHDPAPDTNLDLSLQLPRDVFHRTITTLTGALPAPIPDTPEARTIRDNAAMAHVASLLPVNADEANLASLHVTTSAQVHECLRLAAEHPTGSPRHREFTARADSFVRQARALRTLLLRVQAIRQKREADTATREQAAWIEHAAIGLMADALGRPRSAPVPIAEPTPPEPAPPPEPQDKFASYTEAEQYAILHPRRVTEIRLHHGLPPNCTFGPPDDDLLHAIVTGTSPLLRALDAIPPA